MNVFLFASEMLRWNLNLLGVNRLCPHTVHTKSLTWVLNNYLSKASVNHTEWLLCALWHQTSHLWTAVSRGHSEEAWEKVSCSVCVCMCVFLLRCCGLVWSFKGFHLFSKHFAASCSVNGGPHREGTECSLWTEIHTRMYIWSLKKVINTNVFLAFFLAAMCRTFVAVCVL